MRIEIEIREGAFSSGYGPGFQRGSGGGGTGVPGWILHWLFSKKKKKTPDIRDILKLLRTLSTLDALRVLQNLG